MSNISVTTTQSVIDVTQNSGITVTTPEGQTIDVSVPNSSVNVTNTTDDITILTAGTLNIQAGGITSVNGNTGPIVVLTTDNINEGSTNQYFTNARARSAISASDGGGLGSLSYNNSTGVITYTGASDSEVRALFTGGTGVTITTGTIAIGQAVATTDSVTFASVSLDSRAVLDTAELTTSTTGADQVVDSFSAATYRTAKYLVSISSGTDYQSVEVLVVHDGTTASQTTYADIATNASLATFSVDINAGVVRLLTTPVNAVTAYKVARTAVVV